MTVWKPINPLLFIGAHGAPPLLSKQEIEKKGKIMGEKNGKNRGRGKKSREKELTYDIITMDLYGAPRK